MNFLVTLPAVAGAPLRFVTCGDGERPHPLAERAALEVQAHLAAEPTESSWREGKMYGVLVVRTPEGQLGYLKAFSGMRGGVWHAPGFVPPLFDVQKRQAFEAAGADLVAGLLERAERLREDDTWRAAREELRRMAERHAHEAQALAQRHAERRTYRRKQRDALADSAGPEAAAHLHGLAQQSRADKAEAKALCASQAREVGPLKRLCARHDRRWRACVRLRHIVCRRLMHMIQDCYLFANARGDVTNLRALFAPHDPPSGAGDCAAPKLLAFACAQGWQPLALAEFWWGPPPEGGGRTSGSFYPPCRGKCGPLLPFMLAGVEVQGRRLARSASSLEVVYEDAHLLVVNKPSGLLSVPGRGRSRQDSVLLRVQAQLPPQTQPVLVHRLDEDTSGLLLVAKGQAAYVALQRQFLARTVTKVYEAWVEGNPDGDEGRIELPLRLDIHDRPRQVVDVERGRPATTLWKVVQRERSAALVELRPLTGRTHQLRVHAAHAQGLAAAICGDRLYGRAAKRLWLHACKLGFHHPRTGAWMLLEVPSGFRSIGSGDR